MTSVPYFLYFNEKAGSYSSIPCHPYLIVFVFYLNYNFIFFNAMPSVPYFLCFNEMKGVRFFDVMPSVPSVFY